MGTVRKTYLTRYRAGVAMKGLGLGLAACVGLVGCSAGPGVDIAAEVMPSVVLITYGDLCTSFGVAG